MKVLAQDIKTGEFKPVYLICGEEAFLKKSYKNRMKDAMVGDDTMNFHYFEGKGLDLKEIISLADTMPFFGDRRLILIEDSGLFKSGGADALVEYLPQMPDTTCMLFVENEVDKRNRLYKKVKDLGYVAEMERQDARQLGAWAGGILAKEGSNMTVIMDMAAERNVDPERTGSPSPVGESPAATSRIEHTGLSAVQTKLILEKDAKVTLVQIIRNKNAKTVLNDIGAKVADGAKLSVIHLFLGGDKVYNGCRAELIGKKSNFTADIAYTVADGCVLDMNYVALHEGKKSVSEIRTDGVLHENARKLFRGTIDFKKGAAGAVGNEKEDVLLLDDDVVNQTIPLILCAEEDVEGNHGATIGKLDEDLVFYLESRGMALAEIYKMMAKARIDAVLRFVPDEKTKADVASYLESEGSNGCK